MAGAFSPDAPSFPDRQGCHRTAAHSQSGSGCSGGSQREDPLLLELCRHILLRQQQRPLVFLNYISANASAATTEISSKMAANSWRDENDRQSSRRKTVHVVGCTRLHLSAISVIYAKKKKQKGRNTRRKRNERQ